MKKNVMLKKPSSMDKEQRLLLKKSMSKKAYKEYCRKFRSSLLLGRNYGTRRMSSAKDYARKRRNTRIDEMEF
ncbi:MAG: hypothetical protein ACI396_06660 [Acutalibacteraceae bacterium]